MQRIINKADEVVSDMIRGFAKAQRDLVVQCDNPRVLRYKNAPVEGKVGIVSGGGSGHKRRLWDMSGEIC